MTINNLRKRLANSERIVIDGAMGTEILHRGFDTKLPLWSTEVLFDHPEVTRQIHEDYIKAGAEIIVTNTFSTSQRVLAKKGLGHKARDITILACRLARQARDNAQASHRVYIAGSAPPLEDCYSPELTPPQAELDAEHLQLARDLKDGGVDFILIETHITIREALAACRAAKAVNLPLAVCFCCNDKGELLGGETLQAALKAVLPFAPIFVGINCVPIEVASKAVKILRGITKLPIAVYAQGNGTPDDDQGWRFCGHDEQQAYITAAGQWIIDGVNLIGSCCGSTPDYTRELYKLAKRL
ncbi:MAG TPA: homocysteine S-methyltransferase family protein [Patescibacteria group bacterium]|nr:homocysteine S-methyltransferase family protein [Patescibacteria group bacterium]